jgi:hypothetical protein
MHANLIETFSGGGSNCLILALMQKKASNTRIASYGA